MSAEDDVQRLARRAAGGDASAARRLADLLEARAGTGTAARPRPTGVWVRFTGREVATERRSRSRDLPGEDQVKSLTFGPFHRVQFLEHFISVDEVILAQRPYGSRGAGYWRVSLAWAARALETAGIRLPDEGPTPREVDGRHFAFNGYECLSSPNVQGRGHEGRIVEVDLLPSLALISASSIIAGRGGGTSDMEVVRTIARLAPNQGLEVRLVRREPGRDVTFEGPEVDAALERGIEIRPVR